MSEVDRVRMRCRRGMKELDIVLERYFIQYFKAADFHEKKQFDELLTMQDPELFALIIDIETTPAAYQHLLEKIRGQSHAKKT